MFSVKMDPRVKTPLKDLQAQHDLSKQIYDLRKAMLAFKPESSEAIQERSRLLSQSANLFEILQNTDMPPTTQAKRDAAELMAKMKKILTK
jgi:hypothetical protein